MIRITNAQIWVHDQEEALAFYTDKVGLEVRADVTIPELGDFRWLSVGPVGQDDIAIVLMEIPGPPLFDAETSAQVRELTAKGATGTVFLGTDDCDASYAEMVARGVEFIDKPEDRPYGRDASFRDPSGNNIRLTQVSEQASPTPPPRPRAAPRAGGGRAPVLRTAQHRRPARRARRSFRAMPLDPALATLTEQVDARPPLLIADTAPDELRAVIGRAHAATAARPVEVGSVVDGALPGPDGDVPVRVYRPSGGGPAPTVVFFHGGGWIAGDLETHDGVARRICRDLDAVVVAVHYRRAPEHPFPAPLADCLAAARWVADHIEEFGGRRTALAVAGDGAGATLAAVTALTFRDEGRPLAAQLLAYPPVDFLGGYGSHVEYTDGYLLTFQMLQDIRELYLGDDQQAAADWRASPLRAPSHQGLAPAVIGTAQYDPLCDEGLAYANKLRAAGVDVVHHTCDGLTHAFLHLTGTSRGADAATGRLLAELARRLT
ncbi:hypothetical protein GCM10009665_17480 [Kitasatospora nipponensis]|uniref:VOC domain-containing protein n=1 Tax=Kitasatospora nipponensis TaxID=258049 RepID=A0ABP4GK08_9ACTN